MEDDKKFTAKESDQLIVLNTEGIQEHLYNIVQDAQALGSVVQVLTITPTFIRDDRGGIFALGCGPKDEICPK